MIIYPVKLSGGFLGRFQKPESISDDKSLAESITVSFPGSDRPDMMMNDRISGISYTLGYITSLRW